MKKIVLVLILSISNISQANDGIFAINEVCKNSGCFPSDTGGYPITITQPGSYILTSNLVSTSTSVSVIDITSSNVTLDLNGFALIGPQTCTGFGTSLSCTHPSMVADGIKSSGGSYNNITIKNGSVRGFDAGIAILTGSYFENQIMNIQATENNRGITLHSGVISDSQSNRNAKYGFSSAISAINNGYLKVKDSYAYGNFLHSVHAQVCSNVFFLNNGSNPSADADCGFYTDESICKDARCIGL